MIKNKYNVIGVMSGTSLDGIDIIHAHFFYDNVWQYKIQNAETITYSQYWKAELLNIVSKPITAIEAIDVLYSEYLATVIKTFTTKYNIESIDFVASHGHTALHQPDEGLTYQIGNLQILADKLNQKVVCNFRINDVKLGGQGAPLVPIGDRLLFCNYEYCLNLGGFANVSFENNNERIAFDICPVNIVLNYYVSKLNLDYDNEGKMAATGSINLKLLEALNSLKYYELKPPKSLGLEWVKVEVFPLIDDFKLKIKDILSTYIEHVAIQISRIIKNKKSKVLITGGGVYNSYLMKRINKMSASKIIIPNNNLIEFKEALIFGLLGVLKVRDDVNCLKSVTGANQNHSSGKILIPNFKINHE